MLVKLVSQGLSGDCRFETNATNKTAYYFLVFVFLLGNSFLFVANGEIIPNENVQRNNLISGNGETVGADAGFTLSHAQHDTSSFMNSLYNISSFMEWFMIYFPVPFGSYSKETNVLFGLTKFNAFTLNKGNKQDSVTHASSVAALAYYTLNRQYKLVLSTNLMLNQNKAIWKTELINTSYPLLYYGIGNETDLNNESKLNSADTQFSTEYLFRIWRKWYLGPAFDFYYFYDVELAEGANPIPGENEDLGHKLGRQSGLGLKISMEGRDNRLNAKHGFFVDASYKVFSHLIGSEFNYNYLKIDLRHYITPIRNITIAAQARLESKEGDVPVQSLSLLGGDNNMRGIYLGRYRDKVLLDSQLELRFPIFWIFGGTVFGGLGQVAPVYNNLRFDSFHATYGMGVRLRVDSAHDINLRFDFGFSRDQFLFIMNFGEAF